MFYSVLFPDEEAYTEPRRHAEPSCFRDLNLDRFLSPLLKKCEDYGIQEFFYTPLTDPATVRYRQEVLQELDGDRVRDIFNRFSCEIVSIGKLMEEVRRDMSSESSRQNSYCVRGRMLGCGERYCCAVRALLEETGSLRSAGLSGFIRYLRYYCNSPDFQSLEAAVKHLRDRFAPIQYCMLIRGNTIRVRKYENEENLSRQILRVFEKFRQDDRREGWKQFSEEPYAEHIEAEVLSMLSRLYRDEFRELRDFSEKFIHFDNETVLRFSREIRFYLSWLDRIQWIRNTGLPFCCPSVVPSGSHFSARCFYDLALADKLGAKTVPNDFTLDVPERILVVTGPNQGGKTTFARAFGQIHYLASLGLSVPGKAADLLLTPKILTHFEREETILTQDGRLRDDLRRLHDMLAETEENSVLIVNEIFASTTADDAVVLGGRMMDHIAARGALAVVVTFVDELAKHGPETVSMMSMSGPEEPGKRTFKIRRKPPDGLAHALYLAGEHGLTYEQLTRRLRR